MNLVPASEVPNLTFLKMIVPLIGWKPLSTLTAEIKKDVMNEVDGDNESHLPCLQEGLSHPKAKMTST